MRAAFIRDVEAGTQRAEAAFRSHVQTVCHAEDIDTDVVRTELTAQLERYTNLGSGWSLARIIDFTVHIAQYRPLAGSSFIETPPSLAGKHAVINVHNRDDNECFRWAILSALYPATDNADRVCKYKKYVNNVNWDGLRFPVTLAQIRLFERNNVDITVNVYVYEEKTRDVIPVYITKCNIRRQHIDLLLVTNEQTSHYMWIKSMSALVSHRTKHKGKVYVCPHCIHPFKENDAFDRHFPDCTQHKRQKIILPEEDENVLFWKSKNKTELFPFVIYADFESYLSPIDNEHEKSTHATHEHIPSGWCCYTVSRDRQFQTEPTLYSGVDAMNTFFDHILDEQRRISCILGRNYEMLPLTREDEANFNAASACPRCNEPFSDDNWKVRHHDHSNGRFIGAVCNSCNLRLKYSKRKRVGKPKFCKKISDGTKINGKNDTADYKFFIPIVFHNLKNYDAHHIFRYFDARMVEKFDDERKKDSTESVEIIALNLEKFVSFEILYMRFIDSCQFLNASLEELVENLVKSSNSEYDKFRHTRMHLGSNELLFRKGLFPYEYFDSLDKFTETKLPPKEAFYSRLTEEGISEDEYQRALKVWEAFRCQTFQDYHDLYLKTDVLLLADVFENFRETGMQYYGLDPAQYLTLPSYSWDACLKYTDVKLELITDPEIHLFIESSIRGGISTVTHRHARANNPYLGPDYDPSKPHSYIMYLDANNLYGWAMSQPLPIRNFRFLTEDEISQIDFCTVPDFSQTGYIIQCDLGYPSHLHDVHNDFPLAAENLLVTEDMLSPFCKSFKQKHVDCKKLIPNLRDKVKYVTHYRNLKLYTSLGLKLTKIHRVLAFDQEPWMKAYIDFNTLKRQQSTSEFHKALFKLMNNSVFGKSMENVRNRKHIELVCDPLKVKKLIATPQLEQFRIVNQNTVLVERVKREVTLDKPIYAGFSILELSKTLIYEFHYRVIVSKYGKDARLLFSDTDSLTYHISTDDLYKDLEPLKDQFFDTGDYPKDHFLHSRVNAKVLGKMKDECNGKPPLEFVGLRAKMYSLLLHASSDDNERAKMTAKGIKKSFVRHHVRHRMYVDALLTKQSTSANFLNFRSTKHKIETVHFYKKCLSAYDDKRFVLNDGVSTLAYGHYRIHKENLNDV